MLVSRVMTTFLKLMAQQLSRQKPQKSPLMNFHGVCCQLRKRFLHSITTTKDRKQIANICLAVVCLFLGSAIYVLFRPTTLLMFHWADWLGQTRFIGEVRNWVSDFDGNLPTWIVHSLPFALWVMSYQLFVSGIWWNSSTSARYLWLWSVPAIAITAELAQGMHIVPGHFDRVDLITIFVGTFIASVVIYFNKSIEGAT